MKALAIIGLALTLSGLVISPAFPLSYEIDIGGNGSFETGGRFYINPEVPNVQVDFYIDDYSCPPDDELFGVQTYISLDAE